MEVMHNLPPDCYICENLCLMHDISQVHHYHIWISPQKLIFTMTICHTGTADRPHCVGRKFTKNISLIEMLLKSARE